MVRPGAAGSDREVGTEIDLTAKVPVTRHWTVIGGYSHLFAGDFIAESGSNDDIDFGYLTLQFIF